MMRHRATLIQEGQVAGGRKSRQYVWPLVRL